MTRLQLWTDAPALIEAAKAWERAGSERQLALGPPSAAPVGAVVVDGRHAGAMAAELGRLIERGVPVIVLGEAGALSGEAFVLPAATPTELVIQVADQLAKRQQPQADTRLLHLEVALLRDLHAMFGGGDTDAFHARILETLYEVLGLSSGWLLIEDQTRHRFLRRFIGEPKHRDGSSYVPVLSLEDIEEFLGSGRPRDTVERIWQDPGGQEHRAKFLLLPMRSRLRRVGVAKFPITEAELGTLDAARLDAASALLTEVSGLIDNLMYFNETRELTIRDDLTKAFNRRYFESFVDEEVERARRYSGIFSLIFLDLDNLKAINNAHGHLIGSRVLQEVGKRIIGAVRGVDKVVRFGGDEFCVILPQTSEERALLVAERVREAISGSEYALGPDAVVSVTASFGIATYPIHARTKDDLVRAADRAMYEVKHAQKNSVKVATREIPPAEDSRRREGE